MQNLCRIRVCAASERPVWLGLIPILEKHLPVRFEFAHGTPTSARMGEVVMEHIGAMGRNGACSRFSSPDSLSATGADNKGLIDLEVQFTDDPHVPYPFRGRALTVSCAAEPTMLPLDGNQTVLATTQRGVLWRLADRDGVREHRSSLPLPRVAPETTLKDVFNEARPLEILPLVHWLREISADIAYEGPLPRACFIFDDPNLHWPSYGFVDFQKLARQAARENYHVSFATIPLDGWFTHPAAAKVFRSNRSFLSMAVHGNDHTKQELARRYTEVERLALLRQSIHRIEQIEHKAGFPVCRVMVPPHGACSEEMLALLPTFGFEAACLSHGSLRAHNRDKAWTRSLGYAPSELVQGCPVLPRWGLSGKTRNTVLLAAYLRQPVILRGHHQDLKDGIELLDQLAGFINGLGPVRWANLTDLSRSNYEWRMEGSTCHIKPLGRRIDFQVPEGADSIVMDDPSSDCSRVWQVSGLAAGGLTVRAGEKISVPEQFKTELSLSASVPAWELPLGKRVKRPPAAAFVRRLLTEARDRLVFSY
jgi:hypothetical protein